MATPAKLPKSSTVPVVYGQLGWNEKTFAFSGLAVETILGTDGGREDCIL